MNTEDVKVGMKVVPFQKTVEGWSSLPYSNVWKATKHRNQNYLYVNGRDEEGCFILGEIKKKAYGDYFNPEDFEPYIKD